MLPAGPGPPSDGAADGRWIQTLPGAGWFAGFRIGRPETPAFNGTRQLSGFETTRQWRTRPGGSRDRRHHPGWPEPPQEALKTIMRGRGQQEAGAGRPARPHGGCAAQLALRPLISE
jgi:hypothetical protein